MRFQGSERFAGKVVCELLHRCREIVYGLIPRVVPRGTVRPAELAAVDKVVQISKWEISGVSEAGLLDVRRA